MSFSQPTRAAVMAITEYGASAAVGVPMTATELAADLGDRLVAAAEAVPSLAHHTPMPRPSLAEELAVWVPTSRERELRAPHPWEPHRSVVDNLYARSHHLATSETSMGMAVRLEALDGGTDSPLKLGEGSLTLTPPSGSGSSAGGTLTSTTRPMRRGTATWRRWTLTPRS